ncbi:hypothetical protein B0T26DRAFT_671490 [Lasiosphaeria miniovina]|uniref:Uncharacterized protein n=1 Tax=Lasiosphaeria miniovina TaxID=1954250 RepID=A0AA40E8W1_9PEZI|nr:uncharacterized protein B0T26DRAFT_671490 [Lasiosphaeria miniovina]KAK0726723.1 hypothetical protein B0T26DRAFT_671490 [Lasiosphaeria miniovina]
MSPTISFRSAVLLAAATVSAGFVGAESSTPTTKTTTVTVPAKSFTSFVEVTPKIVDVMTVALSTVTVFRNEPVESSSADTTVTYTADTTGGNSSSTFSTALVTNVSLGTNSTSAWSSTSPNNLTWTTSSGSTPSTTDTTSVPSPDSTSEATATSSKNAAAIETGSAFSRSAKAIAVGFLLALAL